MSLPTSSLPFDPSRLPLFWKRLQSELSKRNEIRKLEASLIEFVRAAWPSIDTGDYQDSWAIEALCNHLQAVTEGRISRLLVNFPPRCGKTKVASVCWQAWTWARSQKNYRSGSQVRFLCGSYNHSLALENSNQARRLILSPWFQERWGKRLTLREDQNTKAQFDNLAGGSRIATSVGGSLLGIGGDLIIIDDPHNTESVESEAERETVKSWWREISSTRLNDPKQAAVVVIMQRLHEDDISGIILGDDHAGDWVHLMLPMRHEVGRHCTTVPLRDDEAEPWADPRQEEGELLWPERFGEREVLALERDLGPYMASGRLQQMPMPKGGGIFRREWWQSWEPPDDKFPVCDYVLASLDSAFTEKESNDPSGFVVLGIYRNEKNSPQVILLHAWRKHLQIHGPLVTRRQSETNDEYRKRCMPNWGLVEWVADSCRRFKADKLLIEAKASGISAAQSMGHLYGNELWTTQLANVKGDKVSRAHAVVPVFSQNMVWAPVRNWAEMVIAEMEIFPRGRYKDLTDAMTQAIKHLRDMDMLSRPDEIAADETEAALYRPPRKSLASQYFT